MNRLTLLIFTLLTAFTFKASAQQFVLSGRITDKKNQSISFASVYIKNSTYGTTTNEDGVYQFKLEPGTYDVVYRYVGYNERVEKVTITDHDARLNVQMDDEVFLRDKDVVDKRGRDTAAMYIMRKVIAKREYYLNEVKSYSCVIYVKGEQKLTSAPKALLKQGVAKVLDLDTNGRGILYQSESLSNFNYQAPDNIKEVTISARMAGITPTFSYNKASDLRGNFYDNIFTVSGLSNRGFVSPVADNALKYYSYKLVGISKDNGRNIDKIELIANHPYDPVFRGYIYIVEGDWRIYAVDLQLTNKANSLNLVDTMQISQQYVQIRDSTWMPASIQYDYNGNIFGFKFEGYYIGIYNNYKFDVKT
ncbi:MAG TPA: DUF5686 family protein, partial [Mucilaginibacter sp.]|nr:DUF5686 family protein [Mucilaginibacter sp.]